MKDDCTPLVTGKKHSKRKLKKGAYPTERTVAFLKLLARNYQIEKTMQKGLQEIILS